MARSTLFCLALVSALVFHTSPVSASLEDFLYMLNSRYNLDEDAALRTELAESSAILSRHKDKDVEELVLVDEGRRAIVAFFAGFVRAGAAKESDPEIKSFLLKVLAYTEDGRFDAVLKDQAQWSVLEEYLATWGKSVPPCRIYTCFPDYLLRHIVSLDLLQSVFSANY